MRKNEHIPPLVTIAIPTFNRGNSYLKDSLKSAVSQTYSNVEIIVSDNASTDNTEELVRAFNDPRIRYFRHSSNRGATHNTNFCVQQARGDYFLLLHDDDLIDNDFLSSCMEAVNYDTCFGVVLTGTRIIDSDGAIVREDTNKAEGFSTTDFFLSWFDYKVPVYLCSTLFNTGRLREMGGFKSPKNLYDDAAALFQLAAKFGRKDVRDVKAGFRRHSDNSGSVALLSDWCEDSLYLLNVMCDLAGDKKELLRNKGMTYFCIVNYIYAANIPTFIKRIYAYFTVYKKFEYSYSPFHYIFARNMLYNSACRILGFLKRQMRKALSFAPVQ
ncbi:MAG: glycosyltransferase [Nitrospirae bacterium]|nr:glycosyltransferase [Nitrospirota bacterium]